jgi:2-dehydro-3-deoxyphosphogluconate aldolase / (4S)-4-hydroxy-2-oxoglutarate aldolase
MTPDKLRGLLAEQRLLAIVRGPDKARLLDCLRVLAAEGVLLVEVSLTSPGAIDVLTAAAAELGDVLVLGAGTVRTEQQVLDVRAAGASFVVTPGAGAGADAAYRTGLPVLAGALTPSEVWAAHERGAAAVKLFPASLGGPAYLRALRDPFPEVPLVPVGGVDAEAAAAYLAAGAIAVGVGSPLLGDAVTDGDLAGLGTRARCFREAIS